jgi:HEAT repeat protein
MTNFVPIENSPDSDRQIKRTAEIDLCLEEIQSKNPFNRSRAIRRLGELHASPEPLVAALHDSNPYVRSAAAEALGHMVTNPTTEVIEGLLSAIDDVNDFVCAAAINSLGLLHNESAAIQLDDCLYDDNPLVVQSAIIALARIQPKGIAEKILPFFQSDQYLVRLATIRAMGLLNYQPAADLFIQQLSSLSHAENLQDQKLARLCIENLAHMQYRPAIPILTDIASREVGLRSCAVEALILMNADEAAPILAPLLNDPSNKLRRHLIELMVRAEYRDALPMIRPLLLDPAISVRESALLAVSHWRDYSALEVIRAICFHDPNPFVRPQAILALTNLQKMDAVPDLERLAADMNAFVRKSVLQAVEHLPEKDDRVINILQQLAQDPEIETDALAFLARLGVSPAQIDLMRPHSVPPPVGGGPSLTLIPNSLHPRAVDLLEKLRTWQLHLPELSDRVPLEKIADLDQALAVLITALQQPNSNPADTGSSG